MYDMLISNGIPSYQIKYGDNLKNALQVETVATQPLNWWKTADLIT
jgi:hypothetical protein